MERRSGLSRGEAALERLLQRIDDAIDEYARARRSRRDPIERPRRDEPPLDDDDDRLDRYWAAWWALPLSIRDWLLWYVPGWWPLAPGPFRRFLLITARLIVRNGLAPRIALRRAAAQLRLPPRRTTRLARTTADRATRQFRRSALRARRERTRRLARWRDARAASRTPMRQRSQAMPRAQRLHQPTARRPSASVPRRPPMTRSAALRTRWR